MALKADPPDFIDGGSYSVSDVSGWGSAGLSLLIGVAVFTPFILIGLAQGRNLSGMINQFTGLDTGSDSGSIEVV